MVVAVEGYGYDLNAPGRYGPGTNTYTVAHHLIKAHSAAYHLYDSTYRKLSPGGAGESFSCLVSQGIAILRLGGLSAGKLPVYLLA